jgi:hypothetical protein
MASTYLDRLEGIETSVAVKAPVRVATTANIVLSGEQTVDGVALVGGDRVLVKDQASAIDNGIWNVSTGSWSRADDFNGVRDAVQGTRVYVVSGAAGGNTEWSVTTDDPQIGVAAVEFTMLASMGGLHFGSVADLLASTSLTVATGEVIYAGGMLYEVAATGASDHHVTTAGGVKLYEAGPAFTVTARLTAAIARDTDAPVGMVWRSPDAVYEKTGSGWVAQTSMDDITTLIAGKLDDAANTVANSNLAQMPTNTIKGNALGITGDADDLTAAEAMTVLGFAMTQATNGSVTIPNPSGGTALIVKWGFETTTTAVSFSASFPTAILVVFATARNPTTAPAICPTKSTTVSGFTATPQQWDGSAWVASTQGYNWLAIGY